MGLTASLYSGITGLNVHGERMTVIGNNLANVNTTGFKSSRMHFEDLMSQDYSTVGGIGQVGRGVRVAAIYSDFSQGAFESTSETTDMAISGEGFFMVSPKNTDENMYTRAGAFRFDKDGYLVDPHGYVLQGWAVERSTASVASASVTNLAKTASTRIVGVPTDIRIENFQSPPQVTTNVTMATNLDPTAGDRTVGNSGHSPYFALMQSWNGLEEPPLATGGYGYSSTIKVYDEVGSAHNVTVYFDQVRLSNAGGDTVWEYIVTSNPQEDGRILSGQNGLQTHMANTSAAGLLMTGTLTFRQGQLIGQSAFTLKSNGGADPKSLDDWSLANMSVNGYPLFTGNFLGLSNASATDQTDANPIEMNFGIRTKDLSSNASGDPLTMGWDTRLGSLPTTAADMSWSISNTGYIPNMKSVELAALSTESFDIGGSSTKFQSQDGFAAGVLQGLSVSRDGVLSGRYSNGQVIELYAVTLSTFSNEWGLRREGGNLFSDTRDSGPALTGQAGSAGKGTIDGNSLEISNADMASEFVRMITTQRGFQANTKVITSADSMLSEVIAMKR